MLRVLLGTRFENQFRPASASLSHGGAAASHGGLGSRRRKQSESEHHDVMTELGFGKQTH
jgi:hypothetical protein